MSSASWSASTPNDAPALGLDTSSGDFTYGGNLPTAVGLTKYGGNNLALTAANAITGNLVNAGPGTITISNTFAFGGVDSGGNPLGIVQIHQGQINVMAGGSLTNLSEIDVGDTPLQMGVLNLSGGTALVQEGNNYWSGVNVGFRGGTGAVNLSGGAVLDATAANSGYTNVIDIGFSNNSIGSSGTVTVAGNSSLKALGGCWIVVGDGGNGALIVSQSGLVATSNFQLGSTLQSGRAGGAAALYLNGGTLSVPQIQNASGATGNLYFNGGVLQASASSDDFITGDGLSVYVQAGGAVIDTKGNVVAINQPLLHFAAGVDGGLTKVGSGSLSLTATNTYNGGTVIAAGTLAVSSSVNLGGGGLTFSGDGTGTLDIVGSVAFTLAGTMTLSRDGAIEVDDPAGATLSGPIGGTGSLSVIGPGVLVLSGTNSYSGGTNVLAGTLVITNPDALPSATSLTIGARGTSIFDISMAGSPVAGGGVSAGAVASVPEPGTLALFTVAVCGAAVYQRLRSRRKK